MWKEIRRDIDLEPETELAENVYLGCNQREVRPELQWLNDKNELFKKLTTHAIAEGDLCKKAKSSQDKGQKQKDGKPNATDTSIAGATPACLVNLILQPTSPRPEPGITI